MYETNRTYGDDDDDDDDDDDVLTLARFPEILPVVTKQAVTKMHLDGRKQTKHEVLRTPVSYRPKENGTNELWYTIPYHLQPNNTRNTSIL